LYSSKADLIKTLDQLHKVTALVVGDIILDRYIWGAVDRISPEAPVPVVDVKKVEERLGGAGNVARNLRSIGAAVNICGFIGDDKEGQMVLELFKQDGIGHEGVMIDRARPTSVKTRVIAQSQQVVRIDREVRAPHNVAMREGFAAVVDTHVDSSNAIILSDYGKGVVSETLLRRFSLAREAGRIGLETRPLMLDPHPANYGIYGQVCIAKPNRREAEAASGVRILDRMSAAQAAEVLLKKWQAGMILVTLGEDGLLIRCAGDEEPLMLETVARQVFDVSGAGDTVTAIFATAVAAGASPVLAGELANIGAGIAVSQVGTVAVGRDALLEEIERLTAD